MINDYVEEKNEAQVKIQGYVNTVQHIVTQNAWIWGKPALKILTSYLPRTNLESFK